MEQIAHGAGAEHTRGYPVLAHFPSRLCEKKHSFCADSTLLTSNGWGFSHCLPGDSITTLRLRAQSHKCSPNSMPVSSSRVPRSPTLLSNSPITQGPHYSHFQVQSFARAAHKTQRKACLCLPVHYTIN